MRHKQLILCIILLLGLNLTSLQAQERVTASGGEVSGNNGYLSYSVGQVTYKTDIGTNFSLAQGVQQSYNISYVTEIDEAKGISLIVSAYPNPTTDYLILKIEKYDNPNLSYKLLDINGTIIKAQGITAWKTSIAMSHLVSAKYILKISDGNKELKIFKIIKN